MLPSVDDDLQIAHDAVDHRLSGDRRPWRERRLPHRRLGLEERRSDIETAGPQQAHVARVNAIDVVGTGKQRGLDLSRWCQGIL